MPIAANERVDDVDAEARRRLDHLLQMSDDAVAVAGIGMQRIGIIAESGNLHAGLVHEAAHLGDQSSLTLRDIEMGDAGIAPIGAAGRPAHQLDASEALVGGKGKDFFEGQIGQNGADEAELHGVSGVRLWGVMRVNIANEP